MHQKEMTPWLWTWGVWGRVKYGSMGRALEDTGLLMLPATAANALILVHSGLRIANLVASIQLNNGANFLHNLFINQFGQHNKNHFNYPSLLCYGFRYHVPRSFLKPSNNLLVVFEEIGGDVSRIGLVKKSVTSVCAEVSENHPHFRNWQTESHGQLEEQNKPEISLHCTEGHSISAIKFSSFGTPSGSCGTFQHGACHAPNSNAVLEKVLLRMLLICCRKKR